MHVGYTLLHLSARGGWGEGWAGERGRVERGREGQAGVGREGQAGVGREVQAGVGREGRAGVGREGQAGVGREGRAGGGGSEIPVCRLLCCYGVAMVLNWPHCLRG